MLRVDILYEKIQKLNKGSLKYSIATVFQASDEQNGPCHSEACHSLPPAFPRNHYVYQRVGLGQVGVRVQKLRLGLLHFVGLGFEIGSHFSGNVLHLVKQLLALAQPLVFLKLLDSRSGVQTNVIAGLGVLTNLIAF